VRWEGGRDSELGGSADSGQRGGGQSENGKLPGNRERGGRRARENDVRELTHVKNFSSPS